MDNTLRCKPMLLPQRREDAKEGMILTEKGVLGICTCPKYSSSTIIPNYLCFVSDRDIRPGDLCFNSYDKRVWIYQPIPCPMPYWGNLNTLKKIEAISYPENKLPLINMDFINKFVSERGDIESVLIELDVCKKHASLLTNVTAPCTCTMTYPNIKTKDLYCIIIPE
jgi:hypothetical protein